jgi:hypothetical protein
MRDGGVAKFKARRAIVTIRAGFLNIQRDLMRLAVTSFSSMGYTKTFDHATIAWPIGGVKNS